MFYVSFQDQALLEGGKLVSNLCCKYQAPYITNMFEAFNQVDIFLNGSETRIISVIKTRKEVNRNIIIYIGIVSMKVEYQLFLFS